MKASLAAAAMVLAALGAGACSKPARPPERPSASFPAGDPQRGAKIAATCLSCHGPVGAQSGDPPFDVPKLGHQRASSIFYALQDYKAGRRKSDVMGPQAATLDDQQMRDVAAYLTSTPLKIPVPQMQGTAAYTLAVRHCSLCHGETGLGEVDGTPILTGQHGSYLAHALHAYRTGDRAEPTMRAVAGGLNEDEIALAASYYGAQQGLEPAK